MNKERILSGRRRRESAATVGQAEKTPRPRTNPVALRAAVLGTVTSLFIGHACVQQAVEVADAARAADAAATTGPGEPDGGISDTVLIAAEVTEAAMANFAVVIPFSLILPLAAWNLARKVGAPVPLAVARCAALTAVAVWLLSVGFVRFGVRPLLLGQ
jgi:hypothetical protein